jgi:hypothetical protein
MQKIVARFLSFRCSYRLLIQGKLLPGKDSPKSVEHETGVDSGALDTKVLRKTALNRKNLVLTKFCDTRFRKGNLL